MVEGTPLVARESRVRRGASRRRLCVRRTVKIEIGLAWKRHVGRTNDRISFSRAVIYVTKNPLHLASAMPRSLGGSLMQKFQ